MRKKNNKKLIPFAASLRKNMTRQERKLWYEFLQSYPIRFMRQKIIGNYIVDFYCAKAKLVVELDGSQHYDDAAVAYDRERTEYLKTFGLRVARFTNLEIDQNFRGVCEAIAALCPALP